MVTDQRGKPLTSLRQAEIKNYYSIIMMDFAQ